MERLFYTICVFCTIHIWYIPYAQYYTIATVAYYNPQSILARIPINTEIVAVTDFWFELLLVHQKAMLHDSCNRHFWFA